MQLKINVFIVTQRKIMVMARVRVRIRKMINRKVPKKQVTILSLHL